jgi:hypothetical protein
MSIGNTAPHSLGPAPGCGDGVALRASADRVRASGVLGEARLRQLFDYLVTTSLAGQSPKEIAIAIDVFGKSASFDTTQDAVVRVYIHKLRRALDDFYAQAQTKGTAVLSIPRGEYRLVLSARAPGSDARPARPLNPRQLALGGAAGFAVAAIVGLGILWLRGPRSELDQVRADPIWSGILKDDRPILIVLGDYYLIGETDSSMEIKRLIREYSVNSKDDLMTYIQQHPQFADRYSDVGLRYLPTAAGFALRNVMAVLAPANRRIGVSKMSDLEAGSLKSDDIVYIGYISGMGVLQDLVFARSRFAVGDSYDEIVDKKTRHTYISQTDSQTVGPTLLPGKQTPYHDYGLFAKFYGPAGNTIVVISGTRDEGVQQTSEAFTNVGKLNDFSKQANTALPLEALLEVSAFDGVNLSGKLLLQSNREVR